MKNIRIPNVDNFVVWFNGNKFYIDADVVSEDIKDNRMRFYKNDNFNIIDYKLNPPVACFPLDSTALLYIPRENYTTTTIES
jgi:hypothetical protein